METLTYIGGPLHGQKLNMGEDSGGAIDSRRWYARKTVNIALEDGGAAACDFLVAEGLTDDQVIKLALPIALAIIAAAGEDA